MVFASNVKVQNIKLPEENEEKILMTLDLAKILKIRIKNIICNHRCL